MKRLAFLVIITGLLLALVASSTASSASAAKPKAACKTERISFELPSGRVGYLTKFASTAKEVLLIGHASKKSSHIVGYSFPVVGSWDGKRVKSVDIPFLQMSTQLGDVVFHKGVPFIGGDYLARNNRNFVRSFTFRRLKNGRWQAIALPSSVQFSKFLVVNSQLWLIGRDQANYPALLRWQGSRWSRPVVTPRNVDAWGKDFTPTSWSITDLTMLPSGEILIVGSFSTEEKVVSGNGEISREVIKPLVMTWQPGETMWRFSPPAFGGSAEEDVVLDRVTVVSQTVIGFGKILVKAARGRDIKGTFAVRRQGNAWILLPPFPVGEPIGGTWLAFRDDKEGQIVQYHRGAWSRVSLPELKRYASSVFYAAVTGKTAFLVGNWYGRSGFADTQKLFFFRKCLS